jgi:membrane protein implicated in regulation of membrane protease activity
MLEEMSGLNLWPKSLFKSQRRNNALIPITMDNFETIRSTLPMSIFWIWIILGLVLAASEMVTGTFYLLFFAFAAFVTAVFAYFIPQDLWPYQLVIFSAIAVLAVFYVRTKLHRKTENKVELDVKNKLISSEDIKPGEEKMIQYQGTLWTAVNQSEWTIEKGSRVSIQKMEGIKLFVVPVKEYK